MWFTLRIIALSIWVGAMAGFAFIVAPIVFTHVGPTPAFASSIAACVRAIVALGFWVALIALLITLFARIDGSRMRTAIVAALAIATICGIYETRTIVPKMESTPLETPAYDALHRQSSEIYGVGFIAALASLTLAARRR